ncbi:MAG TPA: response regulator [Candidatus Methylomirabilis sp.]|nr:response regulator [Candidatus Methylomirabilis sp.]HSC72314.1 response regulator [Candidatus Methylomirabilis sp.]
MKRVLVIDDDAPVLRHFLMVLTQCQQYEVTPARDGRAALEALEARSVDAVLLDLAMPGLHGLEVLRRIREGHPETPVIIVTGVEDEELAAEVMRLGACAYLSKPVGEEELLRSLERALAGAMSPPVEASPGGASRGPASMARVPPGTSPDGPLPGRSSQHS